MASPRSGLAPAALHCVALLALALPSAVAQNLSMLDFSQNVQATNGMYPNNSTLGPEFYSGAVLDFVNVTTKNGQSVDARVTLLGSAGDYEFVGWLPHYNEANGQPGDDLGVYYRSIYDLDDESFGGIAWTITFYEGGGNFTNEATLDEVSLLIYDFDGEPGQSEHIRTYTGDGLNGYQLQNGADITAYGEDDTWIFNAGGQDLSESGPQGSFILNYHNTSSIRFDMFSSTSDNHPWNKSGIFAGIDGNLGLAGTAAADYGAYVVIPEPSQFSLALVALSLACFRRRRPPLAAGTPRS